MNNLMEKLLFVEVMEKAIRLELFLENAVLQADEPDIRVINVFKNTLKKIIENLYLYVEIIKGQYGEPSNEEYISFTKEILNSFNVLEGKLHFNLCYLKSIWTFPETYTFVKNLLKVTKIKKDISIVLSDKYMFEETNLVEYLNNNPSFQSREISEEENMDNEVITLFLPKIESGNPLNWSILVHEIGHALKKPLEKIFKETQIGKKVVKFEGRKMLDNWTEEFCCDLISLKILGPAYLASFITFIILLGSQGGLEKIHFTHPDPRFRINIMTELLEINHINKLNFKKGDFFEEYNNVANLFDRFFEYRALFEGKYILTDEDIIQEEPFPLPLQDLRDIIGKKITRLMPNITYYNPDEEKIFYLVNKIKEGIPISSYRPNFNKEKTENILASIDKNIKSQDISLNKKISQKINKIYNTMAEEPCSCAEIINSGWLYKCNYIYPKIINTFFLDNKLTTLKDFFDKKEKYKEEIIKLDKILMKSIEVAHIHEIFR